MAEVKTNARRDELSDIKVVMSTENGRRFMYRQLVRAGLYKISYVAGAGPDHTAFNEGGRNVGLWLSGELMQADPAMFMKMMEENRT
tara:strand:- start:8811 stop:9071 length:261 start_codon:yes stop_codon:yes gene_type:complete